MPIKVHVTRGLLTAAGEQQILPRVSAALLKAHGLDANSFMQANVIASLSVVEEASVCVGGKPQSLALVEVTVPSTTFATREVQEAFVQAVTDIVDELQAGAHPRSRTFIGVTHAVDGPWGIAGKAYTNADLGAAITAAFAR